MPIKNPIDLYVRLLSDAREGVERSEKVFREMIPLVQDANVKEALEARILITQKDTELIDKCFSLIGQSPSKLSGRLNDIFLEDFRRELAEMQSPVMKQLFVLAKATHLVHFRIAEFSALISAADITQHYGVGVLLESCLADKLVFVERTRQIIRNIVETKVAEKIAA